MVDDSEQEIRVDTRVEGLYSNGQWYPATVVAVRDGGESFTLAWDDGDTQERDQPKTNVRLLEDEIKSVSVNVPNSSVQLTVKQKAKLAAASVFGIVTVVFFIVAVVLLDDTCCGYQPYTCWLSHYSVTTSRVGNRDVTEAKCMVKVLDLGTKQQVCEENKHAADIGVRNVKESQCQADGCLVETEDGEYIYPCLDNNNCTAEQRAACEVDCWLKGELPCDSDWSTATVRFDDPVPNSIAGVVLLILSISFCCLVACLNPIKLLSSILNDGSKQMSATSQP